MTLGRLLYLTRRAFSRGLKSSYHEYITVPKILNSCFPQEGKKEKVVAHFLTGEATWLMGCWMMASFIHTTNRNWQFVIHDDGSLTQDQVEKIKKTFPDSITIIWREAADKEMAEVLDKYPGCRSYREEVALGIKSYDIPYMAKSERFLLLDTDLMFFKKPQEILDWVDDENSEEMWFNADAVEPSPFANSLESEEALGVKIWPKINSGLCLFNKKVLDFEFFEKCIQHPKIKELKFWRREQTTLGLSASKCGKGGLLPNTYEVSLGKKMISDAIVRHYVGSVRAEFYAEGISRMAAKLLPK